MAATAADRWTAYGSDEAHDYFLILFYKYLPIENPEDFAKEQEQRCNELGLRGRLLISAEGINGTLASKGKAALEEYVAGMRTDERFSNIDWKGSSASVQPFPDLHVRIVAEIISTGGKVLPPHAPGAPQPGLRLRPEDFDSLLRHVIEQKDEGSPASAGQKRAGSEQASTSDATAKKRARTEAGETSTSKDPAQPTVPTTAPSDRLRALGVDPKDVVVLDCRNRAESAIGSFQGAEPIPMSTFAQFPRWAERNRDRIEGKAAIMFCTGGVRCEKASALLKAMGAKEAFHLSGGIHRYVEKFGEQGLYKGKNFVFDRRVALGADDTKGPSGTSAAEPQSSSSSSAAGGGGAGTASTGAAGAGCSDSVPFGRCVDCQKPWEKLTGRMVCEVCRELVLCCDECTGRDGGVALCEDHRYLRGHYYWHLDRFSLGELQRQKTGMQVFARRMDEQAAFEQVVAREQKMRDKARRAAVAAAAASGGAGAAAVSSAASSSSSTAVGSSEEAEAGGGGAGSAAEVEAAAGGGGGAAAADSRRDPGTGSAPPAGAQRTDPEEVALPQASKNRRKMVRRQLARLEERMTALRSGGVEVVPLAEAPCRTCSKPECKGTCWGFWVDEGRAAHHEFRARAKDHAPEQKEASEAEDRGHVAGASSGAASGAGL